MSISANEYLPYREILDAIIRVEGVDFHVHKFIFCKLSTYFRALFLRHAPPDRRVFEISGLSAEIMQSITEFTYKGSVSVTKDNVEELFQAADQFNIDDIVQVCCNFLVENLSPENCIHIWQFTNICFCPELKQKAYHFILNHFEEVVSSKQFQQLSVEEFTDILGRDELIVSQESTVYEAVLKWIAYSLKERERHFGVLFSKVRLALTSMKYIWEVRCSKLVLRDRKCKTIAKNASHVKRLMILFRPQVFAGSNSFARPRLPNTILFAIGGWSEGGPTNAVEVYDIRSHTWINVTDHHQCPCSFHGSVYLNGSIYCVGGLNNRNREKTNRVHRFDLKTHVWQEVAPMNDPRCYLSVAVLNGYIYAIGGYDGTRRLKSVERYNPETNRWIYVKAMHEERSNAGCAVLNNRIYICGGFNEQICLDTCEYYSPETNQWAVFHAMEDRRSGIGVAAYRDQIFAVGGHNGGSHSSSVHAYNPLTDTWRTESSMLSGRSNFGIAVVDNKLFAVGGFRNSATLCVEYYDPTTGQWSETSEMEICRSGVSCTVVSGLPNIEDYVISRDSLPPFDQDFFSD